MSITQDLLTACKTALEYMEHVATPYPEAPGEGYEAAVLAPLKAAIAAAEEPTGRDRMACIAEARSIYASNDVAIDDDARLSETDDGTWVQAWVWLGDPEDDAGNVTFAQVAAQDPLNYLTFPKTEHP